MWQCLLFPACLCMPPTPFIIDVFSILGGDFAVVVLVLNFFWNYSYESNFHREQNFYRK